MKIQPHTEEIHKFIQALDMMTLKEVLTQDPRVAVSTGERSVRSLLTAERAIPIALTNEQMGAMFVENAKAAGLKVIT